MNKSVLLPLKEKWVLLTLFICLTFTFVAVVAVRIDNQKHIATAVKEAADPVFTSLLDRFNQYKVGLQGARIAVLMAENNGLDRSHFHKFGLSQNLKNDFPGARGFAFVRVVKRNELAAFVAAERQGDWPNFKIITQQPHQGDLYVVQLMEPATDYGLNAIGFDIASNPSRRLAADLAADSGQPMLTAPINLIDQPSQNHQGFLMMLPIYQQAKTPTSEALRREQLLGWVLVPLNINEVMASMPLDGNRLRLQLTDVTDALHPQPFFSTATTAGMYPFSRDIAFLGRTWKMTLSVLPAFLQQQHLMSPVLTALLGISLSLLISTLVAALLTSYRNAKRLNSERTKIAAIVESSNDGIIGKTLEGKVTSWNAGAERIFGYRRDEAIGHYIIDLVIPERFKGEEAQILAKVRHRESIYSFETIRAKKDGTEIPVSVSVSPIFSPEGQVIGASKTVRDISHQKANEARIRELNSNLEREVAARTAELADVNLLFKNVLSAASEFAIIATDTEGTITLFNSGAERLLGYKAERVVGKQSPVLFHLEEEIRQRAEAMSVKYQQPISGFEVFTYKATHEGAEASEWQYRHKDGSIFPINLVVTAIRNEEGIITGYLGVASDISELKRSSEELEQARDELLSTTHTLLMASQTAELGIWSWNIHSQEMEWNEKMFALYQLEPNQSAPHKVAFSDWEQRVLPEDLPLVSQGLDNTIKFGDDYDPEFRIVLPDGQVRYLQAGAYVEHDIYGKPVKVTGINRDITVDRELRESLIVAKEQADAANAAKSMFLANMSHEIRTPMNAVLGMLQLLHKTNLSSRQEDYASKAQIAATSLLALLNDILDYSKIDAGKLELDPHPFEMSRLMQDLAVVMSANLRSKPIELLFDFDPEIPPSLIGDQLRLQQVLINLTSNAIKFTDKGEVVVKVEQAHVDDDKVQLRLSVTDTGIGISPDQQQRIFEGFTQAEASTTRRYGGTGLGLVICRRLVSLMGGELKIDSALGQGSRFWFELELAIDKDFGEAPPLSLPPMSILLVEDNPVARKLLDITLRYLGAKVSTVTDGQQAIAAVSQADQQGAGFDLVLMDWLMPNLNGIESARRIRQELSLNKTPAIILISAAAHDELPVFNDQSPVDSFLAKPALPHQLVDSITHVQQKAEKQQKPSALKGMPAALPLHNLRLLVVEDNHFNQMVASELLAGEGAIVDIAGDGMEGVSRVMEGGAFDLVLMDMQMPGMDGLEATRRIRSDGRFQQLPIIAMTANVSAEDQQACIEAGMNAHLGKPLDLPKVVEAVLRYTGQKALAAKKTAQIPPELAPILERFGGNVRLYKRLLADFLPSFMALTEQLSQQVAEGDWPAIQTSLHTIKGSAGTAGLSDLQQLAQQLEAAFKAAETVAQRQELTPGLVENLRLSAERNYAEIQRLLPEDELPIAAAAASTQDLAANIEQLQALLESSNLQALDKVELLMAQLADMPAVTAEAKALQQATDAMDFELAARQLALIKEKLPC
ncbi:PAS domain-containing hybrid sensor histidine kinase/response regulator [Gallaecimonas mangrovi]|uniref:PAS domain-containing hybrid sensor histidine kinase/response regulator n=1 Tax=Gallaecimonas mangrovi TaxID=2291597 RepID=UPI001867DBC0|nr:PAS domain S-box protein [Gallaecimonas mangrovi]